MHTTVSINKTSFRVREPCNLEITIRSPQELSPGDRIELQFPNSWLIDTGPSFTRKLQTQDPAGEHYIDVSSKTKPHAFNVAILKRHFPYPEGVVRHGRLIVATLASGTLPPSTPIKIVYKNTFAPYITGKEKIWIRVKGETVSSVPELQTTPDVAEVIRVIIPSCAKPGQTIHALIVSLDRFDNCSSSEFKNEALTTEDGKVLAANLNFIGRTLVPLRFEKEGVFRVCFRQTVSNAIRITPTLTGPYWGDLHIHTGLSHDGQGKDPYPYARDISGLDFAATADHWESMGEPGYTEAFERAQRAYDPGRFVSILGYERNPGELGGHHNIYFRDEELWKQVVARPSEHFRLSNNIEIGDQKCHWEQLDPARAMIIPHHTGILFGNLTTQFPGHTAIDWNACPDHHLRPLAEIYSLHGQSELYSPQHALAYEFNRMRNPERRANVSMPGPYYIQDYWMKGKRIGVIGSSDEHSGQGGRRHNGLAAVWGTELTRESVFDALRSRRCYATTGERILVDFSIDSWAMGECGRTQPGKNLKFKLNIWATEPLLRVEILRFRFGKDKAFAPVFSILPRPESKEASIEFDDLFEGSCMYYARITQEPLTRPSMAWTSPIWIDSEGK